MQPARRPALRGPVRALTAALTGAALAAAALVAVPAVTAAPAAAAPATGTATSTAASGLPATVSADPLPTVQIDGVVWDQVIVGNTVYAAGSFKSARPAGAKKGTRETPRSNLLAYDIRTGALITSFAPVLDAQARTIAASPDGSTIYVGGSFTTVDGQRADRLAAFSTSTGRRVTSFAPRVSGAVTTVTTSPSAVYFGGTFNSVNGQARTRLAAVSTAGALLPWAPTADGGAVAALLVTPDRSRVIIGGSFSRVNGAEAYGSASVDAVSARSMPWAMNTIVRNGGIPAGSTSPVGGITSLSTDGQSVFGSGYNYGKNSQRFLEGTFAADPSSGALRWVNDCTGDTYATSPVGGILYTVGHAHSCSAAGYFDNVDKPSGGVVQWHSLAFTTAASGRTNPRPDQYGNDFTQQQTSDLLQWFPQWSVGTYTGQAQAGWTVESNADYVVVGGEFPRVGGVAQQGLVRFAVRRSAPNKIGPQTSTAMPTAAVTRTDGKLSVTVTSGTWDADDATLSYDLVRDAGKPSERVVGTSQQASSTFWQQPALAMTDTDAPSGQQLTYSVRATDPWGNRSTSAPVAVTTGSWSSVSGQTSTAFGKYVATVGASTLAGRTLTVPFTATGPSDLRRPDGTCLSDGSTTVQPSQVSLTTDTAGSFAGTLTYQLPGAGSYTLQYSCGADYSRAAVGAWDGSTGPVDPSISQAFDGLYSAKVGKPVQDGKTLTVPFTASGPGDLRRPEGTCISNGTTTVSPTSVSLTTDRAGAFAGTLVYTLPADGSYTLQYSCSDLYSRAQLGTFTGVGPAQTWSAVVGGTSKANDSYVATVGRSTLQGTTLTVPFTANGPSDLRRPDNTCLGSGDLRLRPTGVALTTDEPGKKVGTLTYQLPQPGNYWLQYSCEGPYNFTEIGTYTR